MIETPQTEIKRFLKTFLLIAAGILVADFAIGSALKYLYGRQRSGLLYRTSFAIDSTNADYLVLGSSRANHDYDPAVFESLMHRSFYNCGRDKQGILYSCAVLSAILERYHPKGVIIDIRPDEFTTSDEGTLATLLPYQNNAAIRPFLNFNSNYENVKLLSRIYPYNSLLTNLIVGLKKNRSEDYKGYRKLTDFNKDQSIDTFTEGVKKDTTKVNAFKAAIGQLAQLKIPVFIVISPIHYFYKSTFTINVCIQAAKTHANCQFLNFTNKSIDSINHNFSDNNHLNYIGAVTFSRLMATELENQKNTP